MWPVLASSILLLHRSSCSCIACGSLMMMIPESAFPFLESNFTHQRMYGAQRGEEINSMTQSRIAGQGWEYGKGDEAHLVIRNGIVRRVFAGHLGEDTVPPPARFSKLVSQPRLKFRIGSEMAYSLAQLALVIFDVTAVRQGKVTASYVTCLFVRTVRPVANRHLCHVGCQRQLPSPSFHSLEQTH